MGGLFQRLADTARSAIDIKIDSDSVKALDGDTVLTAILLHQSQLRPGDFGDGARAGFCLMGACQDCWVSDGDGRRLRACTTYVTPGLEIVTGCQPSSTGILLATGEDPS
jgi:predicted molibdopterin-dependent oxidoreductase YjgC